MNHTQGAMDRKAFAQARLAILLAFLGVAAAYGAAVAVWLELGLPLG
ncbi:hypothetical protein LRS10_21865 [Phenylobacterium sp. J426]|nr:hypothetical protein [Phenylobacterium sp. J426]MCR5876558.1 hypothetical protein [Phenylobacterium sp. J426]